MHVRILLKNRRHVVIILRAVRANPWTLELVALWVEIERLMLVPDEIEEKRSAGMRIRIVHSFGRRWDISMVKDFVVLGKRKD